MMGSKNTKFQTIKIVTPALVTKSKKLELNKFKKVDNNYILMGVKVTLML